MEIHLTIAKYQESGVIYRYQFFIWRDFLSFLHKTIVTIIIRMSSCIISVYEYRYSYIVKKGTSINHVDRFLKTPPPFINLTFLRFYVYVNIYLFQKNRHIAELLAKYFGNFVLQMDFCPRGYVIIKPLCFVM